MKNQLKVGQTFEVVEVLRNPYGNKHDYFKVNGHTISLGRFEQHVCNGTEQGIKHDEGYSSLALSSNNRKQVGKLTITKVK